MFGNALLLRQQNLFGNHMTLCRCPEVVSAALEGVWRKLMACSSPEWPKVSEVMRRLVQQAGSDADKLRLYK
jgi:hypothetical protein